MKCPKFFQEPLELQITGLSSHWSRPVALGIEVHRRNNVARQGKAAIAHSASCGKTECF